MVSVIGVVCGIVALWHCGIVALRGVIDAVLCCLVVFLSFSDLLTRACARLILGKSGTTWSYF